MDVRPKGTNENGSGEAGTPDYRLFLPGITSFDQKSSFTRLLFGFAREKTLWLDRTAEEIALCFRDIYRL
jgi:hypothetical protein